MNKRIVFSYEKNELLKEKRGVCSDDALHAIIAGKSLDSLLHWNQEKYPGQRLLVIEINNYVYLVPYVENKEEIFLKTVIPSRKFTKIYLHNNKKED